MKAVNMYTTFGRMMMMFYWLRITVLVVWMSMYQNLSVR